MAFVLFTLGIDKTYAVVPECAIIWKFVGVEEIGSRRWGSSRNIEDVRGHTKLLEEIIIEQDVNFRKGRFSRHVPSSLSACRPRKSARALCWSVFRISDDPLYSGARQSLQMWHFKNEFHLFSGFRRLQLSRSRTSWVVYYTSACHPRASFQWGRRCNFYILNVSPPPTVFRKKNVTFNKFKSAALVLWNMGWMKSTFFEIDD